MTWNFSKEAWIACKFEKGRCLPVKLKRDVTCTFEQERGWLVNLKKGVSRII